MRDYFRVFSLNKRDLQTFFYDGDAFPRRTGYLNGDRVFENILPRLFRFGFPMKTNTMPAATGTQNGN